MAGTILAGCNWIRWIYVDGREFDDPQQIIDRFARLLERLHSLAGGLDPARIRTHD